MKTFHSILLKNTQPFTHFGKPFTQKGVPFTTFHSTFHSHKASGTNGLRLPFTNFWKVCIEKNIFYFNCLSKL